MSKQAAAFFKAIAADKFDLQQLPEFWSSLTVHLKEKTRPKGQKLQKASKVGLKEIFQSIQKLMTITSAKGMPLFDTSTAQHQVDTFFSQLLHPQTPQEVRAGAYDIFLKIIGNTDEKMFDSLKCSVEFAIPYSLLSEGQWEPSSAIDLKPCQVEGAMCTKEQALQALNQFFEFLHSREMVGKPRQSLAILYEFILSVSYREFVRTELEMTRKPYGFKMVPECVHVKLIDYLEAMAQNPDFGFETYLSDEGKLRLLLGALTHTSVYGKTRETVEKTIKFLEYLSTPTISRVIVATSTDCLEEVMNTFLAVSKGVADQLWRDVMPSVEKFFNVFFNVFESKVQAVRMVSVINRLWDAVWSSNELLIVVSVSVVVKRALGEGGTPDELWNAILDRVKKSPLITAVMSRFAQYLAVVSAPTILKWNTDAVKALCTEMSGRTKRNKTTNSYDLICENIEIILKKPATFVNQTLKQVVEELSFYDEPLRSYPLTELESLLKADDNALMLKVGKFISVCTLYQHLPAGMGQNNLYSVIYSFTATLCSLQRLPPGVSSSSVSAFEFTAPHMFYCLVSKIDQRIRFLTLKTCNEMMNRLDVRPAVNVSMLTHWYAAVFSLMLTREKSISCTAFDYACQSIRVGLPGATCLIPVLLTLLEAKEIPVTGEALGFLSAAPLFAIENQGPPEVLREVVGQLLDNKQVEWIPNSKSFVKPDCSNLKKRVVECLKEMSTNTERISPAICHISFEVTRDSPDQQILTDLLSILEKSVESSVPSVFPAIESIFQYSDALNEIVPDAWYAVARQVLETTTKTDGSEDPNTVFALINLANETSVHMYDKLKTDSVFLKYCEFLNKYSTGEGFQVAIPENLKRLAAYSLVFLGQYFGNYPFPKSPLYSSNIQEVPGDHKTYVGSDGSLIKVVPRAGSAIISTQTPVGQQVMEFKPICAEMMNEETVPLCEVPVTTKAKEIASVMDSPFQSEFVKTIDDVIAEFEREEKRTFPCDNIDEEDVDLSSVFERMKTTMERASAVQPQDPWKIRPSVVVESPAAAALAAIGRLDPDHPERLQLIEETQKVNNSLAKLPGHEYRIKMKMAVLYTGKGKDDQNKILATTIEEASAHFREFLFGLGYPVDLSTHKGYTGGLDLREGRSGHVSIYYADFENEVMFHVGPLLPTDHSDDQQIAKKRHIGNDRVHIVYCENDKEFDPTTITSQFGNFQIIIYPLPSGLFRVDIYYRKETPYFCPLRNSTIVSKRSLPSLIRACAISVTKAYWKAQKELNCPMIELAELIEDIGHNHKVKDAFAYRPFEFILGGNT